MSIIAKLTERQSDVFNSLSRRRSDLVRYAYTISALRTLNVSQNQNYQRTFNGLYMVRRNALWRSKFYSLLETHKDESNLSFKAILSLLFQQTGRIEASFASKLIATVDPEFPVYDSIVRKNLGLPQRAGRDVDRMDLLAQDYSYIQIHSIEQIQTSEFRHLRAAFDNHLPDFKEFSDTKVLDLLIWQMR